MADGHIDQDNLICGVHGWDYRYDTGVSEYNNTESLTKFQAWIDHDDDSVSVDENEIAAWQKEFPQAYRRDEYLGLYADVHGGPEEPDNGYIQKLAKNGLRNLGHHGLRFRRWECRSLSFHGWGGHSDPDRPACAAAASGR